MSRIAFPFQTPNQLGVGLASVGIVLIAGLGAPRFGWWARSLLWLALSASALLLARTYSRGAYVGFGVGLLTLASIYPRLRRPALIATIVLVIPIFCVRHGLDRAASVLNWRSDLSVTNRLGLWYGVCGIIADEWPSGVGRAGFRQTHFEWYSAVGNENRYGSAVNDPLTVAAFWGIPACFGIYTVLFFFVAAGMGMARSGSILSAAAASVLVCYQTAALFSTLLLHPVLDMLVAFAATTIAYVAITQRGRYHHRPWRSGVYGALVSFLMCGVILGVGAVRNRKEGVGHVRCVDVGLERLEVQESIWRLGPPLHTIVLVADPKDDWETNAFIVRPLTLAVGRVIYIKANKFDVNAQRAVSQLIGKYSSDQPLVVVGIGEAARLGLIGATRSRNVQLVLFVNGSAYWPFPELSPEANLKFLRSRLVILCDGIGPGDASEAKMLAIEAVRSGIEVELLCGRLRDVRQQAMIIARIVNSRI